MTARVRKGYAVLRTAHKTFWLKLPCIAVWVGCRQVSVAYGSLINGPTNVVYVSTWSLLGRHRISWIKQVNRWWQNLEVSPASTLRKGRSFLHGLKGME